MFDAVAVGAILSDYQRIRVENVWVYLLVHAPSLSPVYPEVREIWLIQGCQPKTSVERCDVELMPTTTLASPSLGAYHVS